MADETELKVSRRKFLKTGALFAAGCSTFGWGRYVEPDWVEVTQREISLPNLPPAFDGYRIAQASDIHIESGSIAEDWPAIAELVTSQKADLICLTGDYVTVPGDWQAKPLAEGFRRLKARDGVFAIMGNHDHWDNYVQSRAAMHRTDIVELNNEVHVLKRGAARLHLAGVGDLWLGNGDISHVAAQVPANAAAILLAHEPDFADEAKKTGKFGLQLSGHSHGGQIALPFLGPIHVPDFAHKYPRGLYDLDGMFLYTNRGLGTVGPPVRLCSRPEVTVFTLRRMEQA
jgi:hypothetical protein